MGETVSQITKDMDTYSYRVPIGVCAGITPYVNFCKLLIFGGLLLLKKLVKGSKVRGGNQAIASTQVNSTFGWDKVCVEILIVLAFNFLVKHPTWYCCRNLFLWLDGHYSLRTGPKKRIHLLRLVEKKAYLSFFSLSRFNFPAMIPLWVSKGFNVKADVFPLS